MENRNYILNVSHDKGKTNFKVSASSRLEAKQRLMKVDGCPERAINSVLEAVPLPFDEYHARECSVCGKGMNDGYVMPNELKYYCGATCLCTIKSLSAWDKEIKAGEIYYTEWEPADEYPEYVAQYSKKNLGLTRRQLEVLHYLTREEDRFTLTVYDYQGRRPNWCCIHNSDARIVDQISMSTVLDLAPYIKPIGGLKPGGNAIYELTELGKLIKI